MLDRRATSEPDAEPWGTKQPSTSHQVKGHQGYDPQDAGRRAWWLWLPLAGVIFLGSGLLFLIQPMIGQKIAPAWGGSPAVWLSCLMFFQGVLWLGYSWAWLLAKRLTASAAIMAQVVLLSGGLTVCWWVDGSAEAATTTGFPPLEITWYLTIVIGLPALALATTSPLLQSWLAGEHRRPRNVYRWFAVSNLASLTALLSYPWLLQARWSLPQQWVGWRWGFTLYSLLFIGLAYRQWLRRDSGRVAMPSHRQLELATSPWTGASILSWWVLSFGPAVLLMAVSNQISADLSGGPLLWVWPLGLYLLTYSVAFAWPQVGTSGMGWIAATCGGILLMSSVWLQAFLPAWLLGTSQLAGLFFLSLLSHSALAQLQPPTGQLTGYYWMISVGGWSGGIAVSLLAPLVFSHYYELEWSVLICWWASWAIQSRRTGQPRSIASRGRTIARLTQLGYLFGATLISLVCVLGLNTKYPWKVRHPHDSGLLAQKRTFFGVLRVTQQATEFGRSRTIGHGTTDHGRQLLDGPFAQLPTGYYSPQSGLAAAFMAGRQRRPVGLNVAVLGLGAGNMVHWTRAEDRLVFYEIDPAVAEVAAEYFPNLALASGSIDVRIADGRLGLQQDAARGDVWDLIVMDAFTGDAVPTHLLTEEAWETYLQALAPDGIIAVHISNRYIDLEPVIRSVVARFQLDAWSIEHHPWPELRRGQLAVRDLERAIRQGSAAFAGLPWEIGDHGWQIDIDPRRSHWVLASREPLSSGGWPANRVRPIRESNGRLVRWADDFAPLWPILK